MRFLDHFDLLAPIYDYLIRSPDISQIVELLDLPPSGRLLDVGGGTGRIARLLAHRARFLVVTDESLKMLAQAQHNSTLEIAASYSENLPFPIACFERIIMVDAFHHIRDQDLSLQELWRVLAPGGRILIEEPNIHHFAVKLLALGEKILLMRSHIISPERIGQKLSQLGADVSIHPDQSNVRIVAVKAQ